MKHLLLEAKREIEQLRRENEILRAKVEIMDLFGSALHVQVPSRVYGTAPDVAWALQRKVDEMKDCETHGVDTIVKSDGSYIGQRPLAMENEVFCDGKSGSGSLNTANSSNRR